MMPSSLKPQASSLILLALMCACASSAPMRYYTLTPIAPTSAPATTSTAVKLGRIGIPRELDRSELVQRIDATQIDLHEQDRWAAPFEDLVRRTLADDLAARLPDSGNKTERTLAVEIDEFIADASCNVTLRATWSLTESNAPSTSKSATSKSERIDTPASGACTASALPAAMSRALAELTDRITSASGAASNR